MEPIHKMKRIKMPETLFRCPKCEQITLVVANQGNFCSDRECIYTKVKPVNFDNDINTYDYQDRALNRFSEVYTKPEGSCQDPKKLQEIRLQSNFFRGKKYILDCGYQLRISRSLCEEAVSLLLTILNCLQQEKVVNQIEIVVECEPDLSKQHLVAQIAEAMRENGANNTGGDQTTIGVEQTVIGVEQSIIGVEQTIIGVEQTLIGDQTSNLGEKSVFSINQSIVGDKSFLGETSIFGETSIVDQKSVKGAKSGKRQKSVKGQKPAKGTKGQKSVKGQKSMKGQKSIKVQKQLNSQKQQLQKSKGKALSVAKSVSGSTSNYGPKSMFFVGKDTVFDLKQYYGDLNSIGEDEKTVTGQGQKKKKKQKNPRFRNKNIFAVRFLSAYALHALTFANEIFFQQFNIIKFFGIDLKEWRENTKQMNSILRAYIDVVPIVLPKHIVMKVCKYRHINIEEQNAMVEMCERIAQYSTADVRYHTIAAIAFWKICQFSTRYRNRVLLQHLCKSHDRLFSQGNENMTYKFFDITPESVKKVYKQSIKAQFFTKYLPEWSARIPLPFDSKGSMEDID